MREDLLIEMEELALSAPLTAALLESPSPLADVYKDFRDVEKGTMVLFFPVTSIIVLFTSLWLPALLGLTVLYPSLDETFQIEERLRKT